MIRIAIYDDSLELLYEEDFDDFETGAIWADRIMAIDDAASNIVTRTVESAKGST